jgi:hypothetical protein
MIGHDRTGGSESTYFLCLTLWVPSLHRQFRHKGTRSWETSRIQPKFTTFFFNHVCCFRLRTRNPRRDIGLFRSTYLEFLLQSFHTNIEVPLTGNGRFFFGTFRFITHNHPFILFDSTKKIKIYSWQCVVELCKNEQVDTDKTDLQAGRQTQVYKQTDRQACISSSLKN